MPPAKEPDEVDPAITRAIEWRRRWSMQLIRKYAGKYIAIRGRRVVAVARTYAALCDKLRRMGMPPVLVSREEAPGVVIY